MMGKVRWLMIACILFLMIDDQSVLFLMIRWSFYIIFDDQMITSIWMLFLMIDDRWNLFLMTDDWPKLFLMMWWRDPPLLPPMTVSSKILTIHYDSYSFLMYYRHIQCGVWEFIGGIGFAVRPPHGIRLLCTHLTKNQNGHRFFLKNSCNSIAICARMLILVSKHMFLGQGRHL